MNWLYFVSKNSESLEDIDKLLNKNNANCTSVYIEDLPENFISADFLGILRNSDYVIFNLENGFESYVNFIFALGFVEGKNITSFINSKLEFDSGLVSYSTVGELKKILKKNLSKYVALDEKKKSMEVLFDKGIPFTPDCFSFEIAKNNLEIAELFLKAGMDVNCRDSSGTPMICIASRSERKNMIDWLLKNGADIDAVSEDRGYSAVMDAVWKSDFDLVKYFVEKGASLNFVGKDGQSALILATGIGKEKICEILVKNGADPDFKDKMGMSSMAYAKLFKKDNLINLYKEYSKC
ncbi:MAG: ankyrin repeat domain-containing protein [Treponemataceae bacterium]|nr:ankyrin repeat domain-containing protein [Treponemataceae bacterium]